MTLPVTVDFAGVLERLAREEDAERRELARLEACLRRFEDVERPAYEQWLRLELGPALTRLDELAAELRGRQMVAGRVSELVEVDGLHAREALYVVQEGYPDDGSVRGDSGGAESPDAVQARRQAKRARKRAERRHAERARAAARTAGTGDDAAADAGARRRLVALYRGLARSLHPDSPHVVRSLAADRLRAIWGEVQAAYAGRSLERLLALATWVESVAALDGQGTASVAGGSGAAPDRASLPPLVSLAERHDHLRALRRARRALDRKLAALAGEPAWSFLDATPSVRRKLKRAAARRIASDRTEVEAALRVVEAFLRSIGPPRPPGRR